MSAPGTLDLAGIRARAEANPRTAIVLRIARNLLAAGVDPQWYADKLAELALSVVEEDGFSQPTTLALVDEVERLTRELLDSRETEAASRAYEKCSHDMLHHHARRRWEEKARADAAEAEAAKLRARVAELEGALGTLKWRAEEMYFAADFDTSKPDTRAAINAWRAADKVASDHVMHLVVGEAETRGGDAP